MATSGATAAGGAGGAHAATDARPEFCVLVHGVAKKQNIGNMLRSACAFGVAQVLVVGHKKTTATFGSMGTHHHVDVRYFDRFADAVAHARARGCCICGVEVVPPELRHGRPYAPVHAVRPSPFGDGACCFLLGNEGTGLSADDLAACDRFVYIAQTGNGTASLNVTVAASIVFHRFVSAMGYAERPTHGHKFVVELVPQKSEATMTDEDRALRARRAAARAAAAEGGGGDDGGAGDGLAGLSLFADDDA